MAGGTSIGGMRASIAATGGCGRSACRDGHRAAPVVGVATRVGVMTPLPAGPGLKARRVADAKKYVKFALSQRGMVIYRY